MNSQRDMSLQKIVSAAEKAMTQTLGGAVQLGKAEVLRDFGYPRVLRCPVVSHASKASLDRNIPRSVIIKRYGVGRDGSYNPEEAQKPWGGLYSEWAGAQFLQGFDAMPSLGPRCFGGDADIGIVVVEDLGNGNSLADVLQGTDRQRLEEGLLQYCASLGRLHAATVGRATELEAIWSSMGKEWQANETPYRQAENWTRENLLPFQEHCSALGVPIASGFEAEAERVWHAMAEPGNFLAFTPGDTCPDNHRLTAEGYVRFFDFEACGFRHALLDFAYCYVPFPTCWCVLRLPKHLSPLMKNAYQQELMKGCPDACDDETFSTLLAYACTSWMISAVSWNLGEALQKDESVGLASQRQRLVLHLDAFVETMAWLDKLPAMRDTSRVMAETLHLLWGEGIEVPFYPAFTSSR
ncbi:MAG: hypothetical protein V4671_31765 [Armatimonadota bacterium]